MRKAITLFLLAATAALPLLSQPTVVLDRTYGTAQGETARMIRQTPDGGYVIAGDGNGWGGQGYDIYLIKTDPAGNLQWQKNYGFAQTERIQWAMDNALHILFDSDGLVDGYLMVGTTQSYAGHGAGGLDMYLIRTDENGNELWSSTYGGDSDDYARIVKPTADGGFIITAVTFSFGVIHNDIYLVKTNANGILEWDATYHLAGWESGQDVVQLSDGSYLVLGSSSELFKVLPNGDPATGFGNIPAQPGQGSKDRGIAFHYKSTGGGIGYMLEPLPGGGFMACGTYGNDAYLSKLDANGDVLAGWPKVIVEPGANYAYVVHPVSDAIGTGYVVAGETNGQGAGNWDFWLFRTDEDGELIWQQTYGGSGNEWCTSMAVTNDGGYALTGLNTSFGAGSTDFWLLKVKEIINPAYIKGKAFRDDNGNCSAGGNEPLLANQTLMLQPGPYLAKTDGAGNFSFKVEPGSYTLTYPQNELFATNNCSPVPPIFVTVGNGGTSNNNNFRLVPLGGNDCESTVHIVSAPFAQGTCSPPLTLSSPCPGSQHVYEIALCNTGNQHSIKLGQSELEVTLPQGMTYVGHTFVCQNGNADFDTPDQTLAGQNQVLTWDGSSMSGNIPEMACCVIRCTVFVQNAPPAPPPFNIQAEFNAWCTGPLQHTSTFSLSENDACSCDPNDMQVSPKGCGAGGNIAFGQPLAYRIRFQNIGTGNAHDVMLRDTLDGDLDLSTLQILSSTYEITGVQLEMDSVLVIHFDGIELPPWEIGEVLFSLSPLPGLPEGTTLTNRAGIYFDANPPVITNTVLNTLRAVPAPDADFAIARNCSTPNTTFDFNYAGTTADGADFSWDFGSNATPQSASGDHPTGVIFNSAAPQEVQLTIERLGCSLTKSIWLEVLDTVPPLAICQDVSVQLDIAGQASLSPAQVNNGSSDNCGIASLELSQATFDCSDIGSQTATLTATDFDGNTSECSASVTVEEAIFITEIEVEDESCANFSDGSIFITVFSPCSSPQVLYSIDGGNSWNLTGEFHFLNPGSYEIVAQTSFFTATAEATVEAGAAPDTWFKDMDDDSFSDGVNQLGCEQTTGFQLAANLTATSGDCNDEDPVQFPGQTWYKDADNDGYSNGMMAVQCAPAPGYKAASQLIATSGDCNDINGGINPSATEACNATDDNCDSEVDEGLSGFTYSGNVTFTTQAQVNAFPTCYSVISGNLTIQYAGVNNLSNLANLEKITGNLTIKQTTLTTMSGLGNLDTIGGQLSIQLNSQLATLAGLENLDKVGTNLLIFSNTNLSFCCPVEHFLIPPGGVGGYITITNNKVGCKTQAQILAACPLFAPPNPPADFAGKPSSEGLDLPSIEVFPNPTSGDVNVTISGSHHSAIVRIFDPQGRLVIERKLVENSREERFELGGLPGGIYWVQVLVDGQFFGKRLLRN